ncbi:MAG: GNAT family N-acetyltransferase [Deltaproteobacteria bacterium]|nr:GNAT family N-acetyltransferase [Deltaproteobacteria bacterium]
MSPLRTRAYAGRADLDGLIAFASRTLAARWPAYSYWHPGDVAWMLYPTADQPNPAIRLWLDGDSVAGVAWFYAPLFVRIDACPEAGDALLDEMLDWAERYRVESAGEGEAKLTLSTLSFESDRERIAVLEKRGYRKITRGDVMMRRSLETPIAESVLPDGMRIRDCVDVDLEERAAAHRDAWSHLAHLGMPDVESGFTLDRYRALREAPLYRPDLYLVVETGDGRYAACLIGWADEPSGVGLIEPVGTRDAYRRQGLARALNLEVLHRQRALGLRHAQIGTTNFNDRAEATYLSCGFEIVERDRYWLKQVAG